METLYTLAIFAALLVIVAIPYWHRTAKRKRDALATYEKNIKAGTLHTATLHPRIDLMACIGCAACVRICPENTLGIINGRAAVVSGSRCIGHGLCADVCPVGGITLQFGTPRAGMEIPWYNEQHESNIEGLYIVGELSGMGLIRNAVAQGLKAMDDILYKQRHSAANGYDVVIVGAGPAGIASALACKEHHLRYIVLEQDDIGGTVLHYPRRKLVLTSPVELPLYGRLKISEIEKEELLRIWKEIIARYSLNILTQHKVDNIQQHGDRFVTRTESGEFASASVVLAIGRRGSPRKLNVPGEHLPKVMYRLIEAETYTQQDVLVVGGGDSAVEAAIGLASQRGNSVTISYRKTEFVRLKEKNERRINEFARSGKIRVLFDSNVVEIQPETVIVRQGNILHTLPNDYVFIFAGGELPAEFLRRIGVKLRANESEHETTIRTSIGQG
jgi:thioredoxin reductase (NADPH)